MRRLIPEEFSGGSFLDFLLENLDEMFLNKTYFGFSSSKFNFKLG